MGAENGPSMESIKNFNSEALTKGFALSESFRKGGVLGEKTDDNEKDRANEEARKIINSSFVVPKVAETQINPVIEFNSVSNMIAIASDTGKADFLRQRARDALNNIGLALSLRSDVFEAATKGVDELNKVIPSCLHGIHEHVLLHDLSDGEDDHEGISFVRELVDVFKSKKMADDYPGLYKDIFEEKSKILHAKLYRKVMDASSEDEKNGNVYRWSTLLIYVTGIDERSAKTAVLPNEGKSRVDSEIREPTKNEEPTETTNGRHRRSGRVASERTEEKPVEKIPYGRALDEWIKDKESLGVLTDVARHMLEIIEAGSQLSTSYYIGGERPIQFLDDIALKLGGKTGVVGLIDRAKASGNEVERRGLDLLRIEIKARLAIFDTSKLMKESKYAIDTSRGGGMGGAIDQAVKMGREMDPEVLSFLFREASEVGLNIPKAWNMLQDANFQYKKVLEKIWNDRTVDKLGISKNDFFDLETKKLSNVEGQEGGFYVDKSDESLRSKIVEDYMIRKLGVNGKKSLQLAYETMYATAEASLFNFRLKGPDKLMGAIYSSDDRRQDAKDGKDVGPLITISRIKKLASGWLRYLGTVKRQDYLDGPLGPLYAENIKVGEALSLTKKEAATYFGKVLPSYVGIVNEAIRDSQPDYKKIFTSSYLKTLSNSIDAIDVGAVDGASGTQAIKVHWVLGLMQLMGTNVDVNVTRKDVRQMKRLFVGTKLSDTYPSFMTEEQWRWCLEQKIATVKGFTGERNLNFYQAIKRKEKTARRDDKLDSLYEGQSFLGSGSGKKK